MIRLSISEQGQPPRLVTFNKPSVVLGRTATCDLCLTGKGVSSQHCRFTQVPGGVMVEDLGSTNGTYVNRVRIALPTAVNGADEIVFAVYSVRVIEEGGVRTAGPSVPTGQFAQAGAPTGAPASTPSGAAYGAAAGTSGPSPATSRPQTGPIPVQTGPTHAQTGPMPTHAGSGSTTGAMQTGGAFDDARWVREWERLDKLASEWIAAGRDRTRLLRGEKLAHARRWLEQGRGRQPVPKREHKAFIQAAASAARLRIARNVTIGGLVLGLGGVAAWRLIPATPEPVVDPEVPADASTTGEGTPTPETPPVVDERPVHDAVVAKAEALLATEPELAALLALQVLSSGDVDGDVRGTAAEQLVRRALADRRGRPLRGHADPLSFVTMSPDGRWVASADVGDDSSLAQLWDLERPGLAVSQKLRGQVGAIRAMAFAPDGNTLAIGTDDVDVWLWDLRQSPPTPQTRAAPEGGIVALAWSDDARYLVAGGRSGRARLFDLTRTTAGAPVLLEGHTGSVSAIDVDATGTRIVTGSQDGTALVWRVAGGVVAGKPTKLVGHMGTIHAVALSSDGRWVLTGGADTFAKLWELGGRVSVPRDFTGHKGAVEHVAFAPDSRLAMTAGADGKVMVWKLTVAQPELVPLADGRGTGKGEVTALELRGPKAADPDRARRGTWAVLGSTDGMIRTLDPTKIDKTIDGNEIPAHTAGRVTLGVDARGAFAASGGADGQVRVWDLAEREPGGLSRIGRADGGKVVDVAINAAGTRVLTGSADGTARLWEASERPRLREIAVLGGHKGKVAVAISPNGEYGATASDDGIVRLWRADGLGPEPEHQDYPGHTAEVNDLVFGPDGRVMVSVSNDKTARVWRMTEDPAKDVIVLRHEDLVTLVAIGPGSRWLITATIGQLNLWDLNLPEPEKSTLSLQGHESDIRSVAMSPDGRWAASGDANDRVVLWDLTGAKVKERRLKAHSESVDALAFSPDGKWLASAGGDRKVVLWRLTSKHPEDDPITLEGHARGIGELAWSADGKWLYSGDSLGVVRAWPVEREDVNAGVMVFDGHSDLLSGIAVVSDGSAIVTGSYDGAVRVWPLHPDGLVEVACGVIGRELTAEEWRVNLGGAQKPVCR